MVQIQQTSAFRHWLAALRDEQARVRRIEMRIRRLKAGNPGDVKSVGGGISEMRIDYGPGYRVYFVRRSRSAVLLLAGGDKDSQRRDIASARLLALSVEEEH